jgi:hypothetical protein
MMVTPVAEKSPVRHCAGGVKVWMTYANRLRNPRNFRKIGHIQ